MNAIEKTCLSHSRSIATATIAIALSLTGIVGARSADPASRLVEVEAMTPQLQSVVPDLPLTGSVRARVQTEIGFRVEGRIVRRSFEVGQHITSDQVLATLEPVEKQADVDNAEAGLRSAQAQLIQAALSYDRQQQLIGSGFTTKVSFDAARAAFARAQAAVGTAQAAVNAAREQLSYADLRAGQSGYVVSRSVEAGQVVQVGQSALVLAVDGPRDAVFEVPETLLASPPEDRAVDVVLQSNPLVRTTGTVREISPIVEPATDAVTVKVAMHETPEEMPLGAAVIGHAHFEAQSAVVLPWSALFEGNGVPAVWVLDDKNRVALRAVAISEFRRGLVIFKGGLDGHERVVTAGVQLLFPGQQVVVRDAR